MISFPLTESMVAASILDAMNRHRITFENGEPKTAATLDGRFEYGRFEFHQTEGDEILTVVATLYPDKPSMPSLRPLFARDDYREFAVIHHTVILCSYQLCGQEVHIKTMERKTYRRFNIKALQRAYVHPLVVGKDVQVLPITYENQRKRVYRFSLDLTVGIPGTCAVNCYLDDRPTCVSSFDFTHRSGRFPSVRFSLIGNRADGLSVILSRKDETKLEGVLPFSWRQGVSWIEKGEVLEGEADEIESLLKYEISALVSIMYRNQVDIGLMEGIIDQYYDVCLSGAPGRLEVAALFPASIEGDVRCLLGVANESEMAKAKHWITREREQPSLEAEQVLYQLFDQLEERHSYLSPNYRPSVHIFRLGWRPLVYCNSPVAYYLQKAGRNGDDDALFRFAKGVHRQIYDEDLLDEEYGGSTNPIFNALYDKGHLPAIEHYLFWGHPKNRELRRIALGAAEKGSAEALNTLLMNVKGKKTLLAKHHLCGYPAFDAYEYVKGDPREKKHILAYVREHYDDTRKALFAKGVDHFFAHLFWGKPRTSCLKRFFPELAHKKIDVSHGIRD